MTTSYEIDIMIPESEITARVRALAREINQYYATSEKLIVIGLLRGSFMFIADLVRRLDLPLEIDFMTVSSYGNNTASSSREIRILKDLDGTVKNIDVLVVEDIIDTGHTLSQVLDILGTRHPKSIEVCCLLNKASRREIDIHPRWVGFDIPDEFVVGYGIDYAQSNRNLPHIGKVRVLD
ncbi:MAG: hypoxanthine phosphoribosyltransferase [Candidatus Puniceispirillales bacterium WSBS_2018_MAG_OTU23]